MAIVSQTLINESGIVISEFKSPKYNDFSLSMMSKHNCRMCHGRGQLSFNRPQNGLSWVETCSCVHRKGR